MRGNLSGRELDCGLHDRARTPMALEQLGVKALAQIHLRFGVVDRIALVLDDLEPEVVERATHFVEPVLRLDDDLVEALLDCPMLLLLGEGTEMPLSTPISTRAADPGIEHLAAVEPHEVVKT